MDSSIEEVKLTDGSIVYAVVFVDGSMAARIHAIDQGGAEIIQRMLKNHAIESDIYRTGSRAAI